jgi:MFS family permease
MTAVRRLIAAAAISSLGDGMVDTVAYPLLATTLTQDPALVAGVAFSTRLPWLLIGPFAGVLGDRLDRRRLMIAADGVRACLLAAFALTLVAGWQSIFGVYAVAFLSGCARTVFDSASIAVLPTLVADPKLLLRANARLSVAVSVGVELLGAPIGGATFAILVSLPFFVDAASFALSAFLIGTIRPPDVRTAPRRVQTIRRDLAEGARFLFHHALLWRLTILTAVAGVLDAFVLADLVLFALRRAGMTSGTYGLLVAASGVGGLAAGFFSEQIARRLGKSTTLRLTLLLPALGFFLMVVRPAPATVAFALFAMGVGTMLWNVVTVTIRQEQTPDAFRARIIAVHRLTVWGSLGVGALIAGALASISLSLPVVLAAAGLTLLGTVAMPAVESPQPTTEVASGGADAAV